MQQLNKVCTLETVALRRFVTLVRNGIQSVTFAERQTHRLTRQPRAASLKNVHPCTFFNCKFVSQTCCCIEPRTSCPNAGLPYTIGTVHTVCVSSRDARPAASQDCCCGCRDCCCPDTHERRCLHCCSSCRRV